MQICYYPEDKYDWEDLKELAPESWMYDCLKYNPDYLSWGNYEDYMMHDSPHGWDSRAFIDSYKDLFKLDDLNECVNFYFFLAKDSEDCIHCEGSGYNPETKQIYDDWYDFNHTGRKWEHDLTQDEVNALWDHNRLRYDFKTKPTAKEVNFKYLTGLGHDSINQLICVKTRAKRLGVFGHCKHCDGKGYIYTEAHCRLGLQTWILHPRKGCSRGLLLRNIAQNELPEVLKWLREAAKRNADRFGKLPNE